VVDAVVIAPFVVGAIEVLANVLLLRSGFTYTANGFAYWR
jgi:hypothetical protein